MSEANFRSILNTQLLDPMFKIIQIQFKDSSFKLLLGWGLDNKPITV